MTRRYSSKPPESPEAIREGLVRMRHTLEARELEYLQTRMLPSKLNDIHQTHAAERLASETARRMVRVWTNDQRAKRGLPPLTDSEAGDE